MKLTKASPSLGTMLSDPIGKIFLVHSSIGQRHHLSNDFGIAGFEIVTVQAEERDHSQKADAFVSVPVGMVRHEAEAVGGCQSREVDLFSVVPLLQRSRQRGFQGILVANAR